MTPAGIYRKYKGRIRKILRNIGKVLKEEGHKVEGPFDMTADHYQWSLIVDGDTNNQQGIDISFTIAESEEWDGEEGGVNFMLDVVEWGGRILGGLCPYNYSPQVWVDRNDPEAIEERFKIMEDADPYDILPLIEKEELFA